MDIYIAGVVVGAYFCFTFAAEQMNPFAKPDINVQRAQWRYGRRVSVSALGFGVMFLLMTQIVQIEVPIALLSCSTMFAIAWILLARHSQANDLI